MGLKDYSESCALKMDQGKRVIHARHSRLGASLAEDVKTITKAVFFMRLRSWAKHAFKDDVRERFRKRNSPKITICIHINKQRKEKKKISHHDLM